MGNGYGDIGIRIGIEIPDGDRVYALVAAESRYGCRRRKSTLAIPIYNGNSAAEREDEVRVRGGPGDLRGVRTARREGEARGEPLCDSDIVSVRNFSTF